MIYKKKSYDNKLIYNDDEQPNNKLLKNFFKHKCKTKQNLINVNQKRDYNKTYFSSLKLMKVSDINYKRISDSINLNKNNDYKINKEGKNFNESGCINRNEKNKNIIYQYKNFENKKTRNNINIKFTSGNKFFGEDISYNKYGSENDILDFKFFKNIF